MALARELVQKVKPLVPIAAKRPVKRIIPRRYHALFDPDWHRRTIGNVPRWELLGDLQLDYLKERGLRPEHYLLDGGRHRQAQADNLRLGGHFGRRGGRSGALAGQIVDHAAAAVRDGQWKSLLEDIE